MLRLVLVWVLVPGLVPGLGPGPVPGRAGPLYTEDDPLVILSGASLQAAVTRSSSAWLVQFFSSWCGHCVEYSATWRTLARDVQGTAPRSCLSILSILYSPIDQSASCSVGKDHVT